MGCGILSIELDVLRLDGDIAAFRQGISGVDNEVHQNLINLPSIGEHWRNLLQTRLESNVLPENSVNHSCYLTHHLVETERLQLEDLLAAKRKKLPRERCTPLTGRSDLLDIAAHRVTQRQILEQHRAMRENDREQIVEV